MKKHLIKVVLLATYFQSIFIFNAYGYELKVLPPKFDVEEMQSIDVPENAHLYRDIDNWKLNQKEVLEKKYWKRIINHFIRALDFDDKSWVPHVRYRYIHDRTILAQLEIDLKSKMKKSCQIVYHIPDYAYDPLNRIVLRGTGSMRIALHVTLLNDGVKRTLTTYHADIYDFGCKESQSFHRGMIISGMSIPVTKESWYEGKVIIQPYLYFTGRGPNLGRLIDYRHKRSNL